MDAYAKTTDASYPCTPARPAGKAQAGPPDVRAQRLAALESSRSEDRFGMTPEQEARLRAANAKLRRGLGLRSIVVDEPAE